MKYDCMLEQECAGGLWFAWLSPLDAEGVVTDEIITKRCRTKREAIDRMKFLIHRIGYGPEAAWALEAADENEEKVVKGFKE